MKTEDDGFIASVKKASLIDEKHLETKVSEMGLPVSDGRVPCALPSDLPHHGSGARINYFWFLKLVYSGEVDGWYDGSPFGGGIWLFSVDDGDKNSIMLSIEKGHSLYVGRLDLSSFSGEALDAAFQDVDWRLLISMDDEKVADHCHIYAHGHHWIALNSLPRSSCLCRFSGIDRTDLRKVCLTAPDASTRTDAMIYDENYATNDLFIVESPNGVAVGLWRPDGSTAPIKGLFMSPDLGYLCERSYEYDDDPPVNTMGSAALMSPLGNDRKFVFQRVAIGTGFGIYHILTNRYVSLLHKDGFEPHDAERKTAGIDYGIVGPTWDLGGKRPKVSFEPNPECIRDVMIMPRLVRFPDGRFLITYLYGEWQGDVDDEEPPEAEDRYIYHLERRLYDAEFNQLDMQRLITGTDTSYPQRPFTMLRGDKIFTCWDEVRNGECEYPVIRIERILSFGGIP